MTPTPAPARPRSAATTPNDSPHGNVRPKVVFLTGASSGIGAATAARLAGEGNHLVLAARREDRLRELVASISAAGGTSQHVRLDVRDAAAVREAVDAVVAEHGAVDVMINNAGVMPLSRLDALLVDQWHDMVDVNLFGLLHGIAAVLPHFQRQASGHFVTVASIGAHRVSPTAAVYCATKYAAWAVTEGLRQELDPAIRVTTITPGVVESELAGSITDPYAKDLMREYRRTALPADAVAAAISYAMSQPAGVDVNEIVLQPTAQR